MLEHSHYPVEPNSTPILHSEDPVSASQIAATTAPRENADISFLTLLPAEEEQIEDFLDQVCAPLVGLVSYSERRERRAEMRAHLENTIDAHLELGSDPAESVSFALRRFGNARKLGQTWRKEYMETLYALKTPSPRNATRVAARTFGIGMVAAAAMIARLESMPELHHGYISNHIQLFLLFTFPLVAGWISGQRVRSRPVLGALYAQLPIMAAFLPLYVIFLNLFGGYHPSIPSVGAFMLSAGLFINAMLTPIGCASAWAGNWLRWKRRRRALT